jgi:hypothetical protein
MVYTSIRKELSSNLGWGVGYHDFFVIFLNSSNEVPG